jgi:benzoate membrane transport protein
MLNFEKGYGIRIGLRDFKANMSNISSGITGMVYSISGIIVLYSTIGHRAGLSQAHIISWLFTTFFIGGLLSVFYSLYYKQPIVFAASLPAAGLVGSQFGIFGIPEMCGGFILCGVLLLLAGVSGIMGFIKKVLPVPIVMGMIAGIFMNYAINLLKAVQAEPFVCGFVFLSFLFARRFLQKIPSQLIALIASIAMVIFFRPLTVLEEGLHFSISLPMIASPKFTLRAFTAVSLPLLFLALTDVFKAYGVLTANQYQPPLNSSLFASGIASIIGGFTLAHAMSLAGAGTAIVATESAGPREQRYVASVIKNSFSILLALLLGFIFPILYNLPTFISDVLAALAMIPLFMNALGGAFGSSQFQLGAFTALVVGISGFVIGNIGTPVCALASGVVVSLFTEWNDFKKQVATLKTHAKEKA